MNCSVEVSRRRHERLRLELMRIGMTMNSAAQDEAAFREAHARLAEFCAQELVPHLQRDEAWLTRAGQCPEARLLAAAMGAEARAITGAVQELAEARNWAEALGAARVVHALFAAHIDHAELLATAVSASTEVPAAP